MSLRTREKIEREVEELLATLDVVAPPVDVEAIARHLDYQVVFEHFRGNLSGTLIRQPDGSVTIGINSYHALVRQRFSIAHEIGHARMHLPEQAGEKLVYVDPPSPQVLFRDEMSASGTNRQEIDANRYAASLLMPRDFIGVTARALLSQNSAPSDDEIVVSLARTFRVSEQAMRYRLVNLGIMEPA
jgi:Zn-dependent peptidase ImmA (M78 family)